MGEGLEETMWGLQIQFSPLTCAFVISSDFEEEEQVEKRSTEVEEEVEQPIKVEQLANFSLASVQRGFFDVEADYLNIFVVIPTKAQSKYMMRCKGKEHVEEGSSLAKVTLKQTPAKVKEIQKMLQWI
jgi:hypothetical protein